MTAQVSLLTGEASNTLLVPVQAVDNQQVQVLTGDNRLETRRVKTGITDNVDIQILDGLTAGEKVVLSRQDETQTGERDIL
ncbi:efflux transporter periplasmic adaptor subunit, partial [Salmonella enterica]|nr:efflux transporter periplasmic adaptor subunit [Salmonella enterica]